MGPLAMTVQSARAFNEGKHRRDQRGRFTSSPPSMRQGSPQESSRSLTRGESWQRIGTKISAIPTSYTGSDKRELPVGSFERATLSLQHPKTVSGEDHAALMGRLVNVIKRERDGAIERGKARGLIPEGIEPRSVNRAYNHASMLALHAFGVADYDFKMDDHLKAEMKPLVGFMRYAHRRVKDVMFATNKGQWRPYRQEFGKPFADNRQDKAGVVRLRVRPNQELIKASGIHPLAYALLPDSMKPMVDPPDVPEAWVGERPVNAPVHVAALMPIARRILGSFRGHKSTVQRISEARHARSRLIADPDVPLSQALNKSEGRDRDGKWIAAVGALGAVTGALLPRAIRRAGRVAKIGELVASAASSGAPIETRGTTALGLTTAAKAWRSGPQHALDMLTRPTAVGRTPTGKQLRRQFARDSFVAKERFVATDSAGKVLHNIGGGAANVRPSKREMDALIGDARAGRVARTYHNHPIDSVPSARDAATHGVLTAYATKAGVKPPSSYVYGFGRTSTGVRTRVTRYDDAVTSRNPTERDWSSSRRYRTKAVEKGV